ncbi:hypothetical protein Ciccas_009547, partial [Cichlidogyrus casuarinus]
MLNAFEDTVRRESSRLELTFNALYADLQVIAMEKLKFIFYYLETVAKLGEPHSESLITTFRVYRKLEILDKTLGIPAHFAYETVLSKSKTSASYMDTAGTGNMAITHFCQSYFGNTAFAVCVQKDEEMLLMHPETLAIAVVCRPLSEREALIIKGLRRYSNCKGQDDKTFEYAGHCDDRTA